MTVLIFIIILLILLISHEFGHFVVAKWSGMKVEEFGIGFPPRLFSGKFGETHYSLNLIPFGAFVKIQGEDGESPEARSPRSFSSKSLGKQAAVVVAGVVAHIILAVFLYSASFLVGMPTVESPDIASQLRDTRFTIAEVVPNSPSQKAGLEIGDRITAVSSLNDVLSPLEPEALVAFVGKHAHDPITISYEKKGETSPHDVTVTPATVSGSDKLAIGVATVRIGTLQLGFFSAVGHGVSQTFSLVVSTVQGYGALISQAIHGHGSLSDVSGPIGIAGIVGDAWRLGFLYVVSITAILSVNLAIINLIPFPALDGGRLLFIIIEKIRRRAISPKITGAINGIGFGLLILLMLVVTYHDIARIVAK